MDGATNDAATTHPYRVTDFPAAVFFMIAALTVVMKHKYKYKMQIQNAKTKYKDQ